MILHYCLLASVYLYGTSNSVNTGFPLVTERSIVLLTGASLPGNNNLLPQTQSCFQFSAAAARHPCGDSQVPPSPTGCDFIRV